MRIVIQISKEFQFHYGTIRRNILVLIEDAHADFNSTMVRLEAAMLSNFLITPQFQFHYGTIRSADQRQPAASKTISIPLWYD